MPRSPEQCRANADDDRIIVNIDGLQELPAIRQALGAIQESIEWWINNHRRDPWLSMQAISTVPHDSNSPDWTQPANTVSAGNRPANAPVTPRPSCAAPPRATSTDALDAETQFCCQAPDLQWTGDPHFPGVACRNCGYIVADCGSVVMHPSPQAHPEPREQQRDLFAEH